MRAFDAAVAKDINACGKYLQVSVYRDADGRDFSMNGITARFTRLYVPHPEGYIKLEEIKDPEQVLELMPEAFPGCGPRFRQRGVGDERWVMAGGNYVGTCDSRFSQLYGGPASVHDRIENYPT